MMATYTNKKYAHGRMFALALTLALFGALFLTLDSAQAAPDSSTAVRSSRNYHVVQRGDSLGDIARHYGVTVKDIKEANGLTTSTIYVGQRLRIPSGSSPTAAGCASYYKVRKGDNLTRIAARYNMNVSALARANGLSNASHIVVGQRICIPNIWGNRSSSHSGTSSVYIVQRGDTLSQIAKSNGTTVRKLMHLNNIHDPNHIYVGQRIKLW
jgi:LysM repeat protein